MKIKKINIVELSELEQSSLYHIASVECGSISCGVCPLYNDEYKICIRNLCKKARELYYNNKTFPDGCGGVDYD